MRQGIHPEYNELEVVCSCGNKFTTRSTTKEIRLDICSQCHPYYTGTQRLIDTAGRVDKFRKREAAKIAKNEK